MKEPACYRCRTRRLSCQYVILGETSSEDRHIQGSQAPDLTFDPSALAVHSTSPTENMQMTSPQFPVVDHLLHKFRSWPRIFQSYGTQQLPPIIHWVQLVDGRKLPRSLQRCVGLLHSWVEGGQGTNPDQPHTAILREIEVLLSGYHSFDESDLLAAAQSLFIYLVLILFDENGHAKSSTHTCAQLLIDAWGIKRKLAATGLFLQSEMEHRVPAREDWAIVSAKRQLLISLHHIEHCWAIMHGYPVLACEELDVLPAFPPRHLWHATDADPWSGTYEQWLQLWSDGYYSMAELFRVRAEGTITFRDELWLSEAGEIGTMMMVEIKHTPRLFDGRRPVIS